MIGFGGQGPGGRRRRESRISWKMYKEKRPTTSHPKPSRMKKAILVAALVH
jgi:hypothetical protein